MIFRDAEGLPEMVVIPRGAFTMGSPEQEPHRMDTEGPRHCVVIGRSFALGRTPVTFAAFDAFVDATGEAARADDKGWGRGTRPVIGVTAADSIAYCDWLSQLTGARYHLPSEAQWENACRAGTTTAFSTGDSLGTDLANVSGTYPHGYGPVGPSLERTTPVGSYPANPFGLHDMHGNVWERCADHWHFEAYIGHDTYPEPLVSPDGRGDHVLRGGSYDLGYRFARSACRAWEDGEAWRMAGRGFRVARVIEEG